MPRQPHEWKAVHAAADALEPRLAQAFRRAVVRMRERISINDLALILAAKDAKAALAFVVRADTKEALAPAATVVREAFQRGGRVGAETLNRVLR